MADNYPTEMSFFLRSFSNVARQQFLIKPAASGDLSARGQMQFQLPTNALLHLKNTRLLFSMSAAGGGTTHGRLGPAKSIIDRISVDLGGVSWDSGCANSNVLAQALDNMKVQVDDPVDSHSKFYRRVNGVTGQDFTTASEVIDSNSNTQCFSIPLGPLFESIQPNIMPLQILPTVTITIFLSGNAEVVASTTGGTSKAVVTADGNQQGTYTIKNYELFVSALSIDDGMYDQVIQSRLNSGNGLDAVFCSYESFSDTFATSTRVSSAASSLDRIIAVWRDSGFGGIKGAEARALYNGDLGGTEASDDVLDQSECRGTDFLLHPNKFSSPTTVPVAKADDDALSQQPQISLAINSTRFPAFDMRLGLQSYTMLKQAFEVEHTANQSLFEYLTQRCQVAYKFNLPRASATRSVSGLNLQGSNSSVVISAVADTSKNKSDSNIVVFLESTKILRIMNGKQCQIIS
jgi:hypothetical protein